MSNLLPLKRGFTIYQSPHCPYCRESLQILTQLNKQYDLPVRNIDFDQIDGGKDTVVDFFRRNSKQYEYNPSHNTRPIIFYNQRFIGGNSELKGFLQETS